MKRMISLCVTHLFLSPLAFAGGPTVTMSGPTPTIASSYGAGISSTVIYTITNNVPNSLPVTVSGITGAITRTTVANDCGTSLPAAGTTGPSTCNIGITITPTTAQIGSSISQTMEVNYQGRTPLTSDISFSARQVFAYVSSWNSGAPDAASIYQCGLTSTASFENCALATNTSANFENITFATVNGTQYAYVADNNGNMYQCTLNTDGSFNLCATTPATGAPAWEPQQIAFQFYSGTQYAYVADNNGNMYQCTLNTDGSFNLCATTPATDAPDWSPAGIAFAFS